MALKFDGGWELFSCIFLVWTTDTVPLEVPDWADLIDDDLLCLGDSFTSELVLLIGCDVLLLTEDKLPDLGTLPRLYNINRVKLFSVNYVLNVCRPITNTYLIMVLLDDSTDPFVDRIAELTLLALLNLGWSDSARLPRTCPTFDFTPRPKYYIIIDSSYFNWQRFKPQCYWTDN